MAMAQALKLIGVRDGEEIALPSDLDALAIETDTGVIYIDLGGQVPNCVLVRGTDRDGGRVRLIASPMESGRLLIGVAPEAR